MFLLLAHEQDSCYPTLRHLESTMKMQALIVPDSSDPASTDFQNNPIPDLQEIEAIALTSLLMVTS